MLNAIERKFPDARIDNPAQYQSEDMTVYLAQVRAADIIVCTSTVRRFIGKGVFEEIQLARSLNKQVLFCDPIKQHFFDDFAFEEINELDWKKYVRVRVKR